MALGNLKVMMELEVGHFWRSKGVIVHGVSVPRGQGVLGLQARGGCGGGGIVDDGQKVGGR